MKFIFTILIAFIICNSALAQQSKTGAIKGHVTTADGHNAAYVTVKIVGKPIGATTDETGMYDIHKLKAGNYFLRVSAIGLASQEKSVEVLASETTTVDFVLQEDFSTLQEVSILTNSKRYKADKPSSSLRLKEPLLEIPQNIQIVTSSVLSDQQTISMSDGVIRNVSGAVRLEHWGDLYTNILMRGSQLQAFRNGFNVVSSFWGPLTEDMSIVDHIEFVKGPAGFMLANGDPSGLYNVVTKKPTGEPKGEISTTLGSYNLFRTALDLDGKIDQQGKVLYRLNMAAQNKKSHRENEFNDRYTFAPVLSYQLDNRTKLTGEYTLQYAKMSDVGSYYIFAPDGYGNAPVGATSLQPGLPATKIKDHSAFINLEHQFNDQWAVTAQLAYLRYIQSGSSMWPSDVNPDGTLIRNVGIWDADSKMALGQIFINGGMTTGSVHHRILAGLDLGDKDYMADWSQSHNLDLTDAPFNYNSPNFGFPANGYPAFDRSTPLSVRSVAAGGNISQKYSGVYLQDELGFIDNKLRVTLAGRYSKATQAQWGGAEESSSRFTPRIGLSASITENFSIYGLYDEAFIPQSGFLSGGQKVKPLTGSNKEIGLKKDWFEGKWSTTLSAYYITKHHELSSVPSPDEPNVPLSIELGEKIAKGIEFDLRGEILNGLNATINYAFTDAKITELDSRVTQFNVGDPVPGFAKHTINSWLGYKIQRGTLKGAGLSGGFTFLADRATQNYDPIHPERNLPDYFKLDAGTFYETGKIRLTANVFNVLDRYLYSGAYYTGYFASTPEGVYSWQTEAPRNYRLSITYKF